MGVVCILWDILTSITIVALKNGGTDETSIWGSGKIELSMFFIIYKKLIILNIREFNLLFKQFKHNCTISYKSNLI